MTSQKPWTKASHLSTVITIEPYDAEIQLCQARLFSELNQVIGDTRYLCRIEMLSFYPEPWLFRRPRPRI